jgi:hypothetical protein
MVLRHTSLGQISRRQRLLYGLSAVAFLASVAMPITIDTASMAPGFKSALAAGNGNGNGDGQGKGKGNGNGRGDENGGGKKPPKGDDDTDDDNDAGDDDGEHDERTTDRAGNTNNSEGGGGNGGIDETALADAVAAVDGMPGTVPAGLPAATLPTIQQIFELGEGSGLNTEQELLAIQNGWNTKN